MNARHPQFCRALLPSISKYLQDRRIDSRGRGAERRADCPVVAHSSKQAFSFNEENGAWWCHACNEGGDVLALHQAITGLPFLAAAWALGAVRDGDEQARQPARVAPPSRAMPTRDPAYERKQQRKAQTAREIWNASSPLAGSPGEAYLLDRGCRLPPADGDLRFLPDLKLWDFRGPALAGRISSALEASQGIGLHITWLHLVEGRWRRLERRYLGRKAGGVIRLWPDVTTGLAVAEGVETALAAAHAYAPIWSCLDASGLASFPVLAGIESLTIFSDRDESGTGQAAAADCADRWLDSGREVLVMQSDAIGHDIADEVATS